jgi:ribosomal subunit interface protein
VELTLNGRGLRLTDQHRRAIEHRVAKLDRRPRPTILRVDVVIIHEPTPRVDGGHRVQMTCETPRRTFRAEGAGDTVDVALDRAFERVERQISTYRSKRASVSKGARAPTPPATPEPLTPPPVSP